MPQILKDESRDRIIDSAKEEFLEHGYRDASMRRIAQKSQMTVGNLYRYFKNKEDINQIIVQAIVDQVNDMILRLSGQRVDLSSGDFDVDMTTDEMRSVLIKLSDELVDIYWKNKIEFKILLMHSKLNDQITEWMASLIRHFIIKRYQFSEEEKMIDIISGVYATATFSGMNTLFNSCDDLEQLKTLSKAYMLAYVSILDNDVESFMGG